MVLYWIRSRQLADPNLIRASIEASGLSARRFAERVMTRDERTIRRWVSGEQPIPATASVRLVWFLALPKYKRAALVELLDDG